MEVIEAQLFGRPLAEVAEILSYSRRLACVWGLIQAEFGDETLTLDRAASHCGISRSHLNTRLDEELGLSFHQLLSRFRLLKAVQLSCQKDYTFLEIALQTGFDNLSNFGRHFEKAFGCSPRELRSQLRERARRRISHSGEFSRQSD